MSESTLAEESMNCPNVHRHYDLGDWVSDNEGGKLRCLSLKRLDRGA